MQIKGNLPTTVMKIPVTKKQVDTMEEINFIDTMEFLDDNKADLEAIADVKEHLINNDQDYF
eukprot:15047810-Ditylum_brightwellii.AAC.1